MSLLRRGFRWATGLLLGVGVLTFSLRAADPLLAFAWRTATPESEGLSAARLSAFRDALIPYGTKTFLVIRHDAIVHEWYAADFSATKPHYTASMAKALVGGVAVAVALSDGRLALDDPAAKFIPQWRNDPAKSRITVRQLGSHTSGVDDAESGDVPHAQLTGWQGDFWKRLPPPNDPFTIARDAATIIFPAGERHHYSNPGIALLAYVTTAAIQPCGEKDIRTLLRARVMRPIGVPDAEWNVGYGQTVTVAGLPLVGTWGGANYTARATARVARLMLRDGNWQGRQLISAAAVRAVTRDAGTPGNTGIGWWSNNDGTMAALPRDTFWGAGAQHQLVVVIPSLDLIVVRNGGELKAPGVKDYTDAKEKLFFNPLMAAIRGAK